MAVNGKSRRSYRGAPVSNTLGTTLNAAATNITLAVAMSGFSTDAEPFFVVVDPGTAKEEKICVKYSTATTLTVVDPAATSTWGASSAGRGADGTTDRQHEQGAVIYPVFTALEANQSNELVSKYANAGSVVYQGSGTPGTFTELVVGTAAQVLKVNSGATAPEWGQVTADGLASNAVTTVKILDSAVTSAKIADATIVQGDLALTLLKVLCPVGTISAYAGATAPSGWILCDGTAVVSGTHPELYALCATTPDLKGRFALGKTAAGTGSTLLGTGGSTTITTGNLPSHSHANTATAATTITDATHSHTITVSGAGTHAHDYQFTNDAVSNVVNAADSAGLLVSSYTTTAVGGDGSHSHTGSSNAVSAGITAATTVTMTNASTGSGDAYNQPFVSVNYIIKHDYV
jgi:microcystin-dependent protein